MEGRSTNPITAESSTETAATTTDSDQSDAKRDAAESCTSMLLLSYPVRVEPVQRSDGERAAALWQAGSGLSLADRLCLALGRRLESEILTADRTWAEQPGVLLIR